MSNPLKKFAIMKNCNFLVDEIEVIKEAEELNNDQLAALVGGTMNHSDPADCKCGDVNCNVN